MKRSLYLLSSGQLSRKDRTLRLDREGDAAPKYFPIEQVQDLHVFGEVDLNKRLLEFFTEHQIPVHFYNRYGYYVGSYYPREYYNSGYLLLQQARHYLDYSCRLDLARRFVRGALENMMQVLRYYSRRGQSSIEDFIKSIKVHQDRLTGLEKIPQLMQAEGQAWESFYKALDHILDDPEFALEQRSRRPPRNRLNALISFVNSLLYTSILSEIYKTHLDPRIGFLHEANFRRFSLNLDVAEVFKPIVVDRLVLALVQKGQIQPRHFETALEGVYLTEEGRRKVLEAWEERMQTTLYHRALRRHVSYRRLLRLELYKLEKHLLGETPYEPYRSRW